ncbi:hypothetical protein L1049_025899 [Liquidambar formosana]|uniref:AIPP2-like SPOC-like domain-containing protein n=1 Tax=Liquidambar formosana TaxID=63359 RepID=A0AAP0NDY0_LIQFO
MVVAAAARGCCGATDAPTSTVTVCQKCGDYGFYEALIFCVKCQVIAEHLYCSDELPETFNEHVGWACEFCVPRAAKQTTLDKHSPTLFRKSDQICLRSVPTAHSGITLKKLNNITGSNANTEVRGRESSPSLQPRDVHSQIDVSKSALLIGDCSSLVENISSCYENHGEDQEFRKKRRLVCDDGGKFDEGVDDVEDVEYVKVKSSQVAAGEPSNIVENNLYVHAQPIFDPIWRGSFNTCNGYFGATDGLAAHLSSKACLKVFEVASLLPAVIHLEMLPKPDVWPKFFDQFKPTDDNIALYFFQENERDEKDFDILVNNMIGQDLAMKAVVENIELLIFTSLELPMEYWRFQGKHYLWGLFRGSKASPLDRLKAHHFIQKSSINVGTREERNLTKIWDIQFSPHPLSNNGKKEKKRIKRMKPKIERERKALTLRKCHFIQSLRPCCKRIRSKANRMNPFPFNKKVVSGNTPRTGALMQEVDQLVLNAWSKHMPEALEQPAGASKGPFKAGTSQDELSAANGVTISTSVAAVLPQEVTHEIEETSMNEEVDQLALKSPSNLEQPAGTSRGPFKAGTNQELSASNGFTVMAGVATVLPQEVTHAIVETSMNEVDQLVLNAPSKHILEGLAQPAGTNKGPFKAGTSQDELPAANGVTIRTSVAAVLLEEVTHEIVETSMNEGTSRGPVNAGNNQDELLAGNGDAIRNSLVVILPQKITQAAVKTSMNEDKVPSKRMPEGLEQPIGTGEGPRAVPIKRTPEATVPSAIPSAISKFMASAPDVQSTTATQSQEVPLHTMLEGNQEGEGTSSPEQLDSQSIYPSILNTVSICDELIKSDETVPLDNSLAQVGPYFVKSRLAPILQAVIDKHGDIAQDCIFEMNSMRSCVLERICEVIQELQGIPFRHLKGHHLASLYSIVQYAEPEKMKVEWLRCRHNELKEAARSIHQYESTKKALSSSIEVANSLKRTLDLKKADMMKLQSEFQSLENQLTSLEAEAATLDCSTSKYEWFHKSLVDGLL